MAPFLDPTRRQVNWRPYRDRYYDQLDGGCWRNLSAARGLERPNDLA